MSLEAVNISKSYRSVVALRGASLTVAPGEMVLLVGRSGAGKSTLARILALVEGADEGVVRLNGIEYTMRDGRKIPSPRPWPAIGMLFQQGFVWPHVTARENIR